MQLHPILEKKKSRKGLVFLIILILLAGFIASVYLFGLGAVKEIIHP